jgi:cation:H+ antiporter
LLISILQFAGGVALLVGGAWIVVGGGSRLATLLGVRPVIVGLTVVAFGTSAPELFVSVAAAIRGSTDLMLGNVIGSNLANIGLILGLAALLTPVGVDRGIRRDVWILVGVSAAFALMCLDRVLGRGDAVVLVAGLFAYQTWMVRHATRTARSELAGRIGAAGPERSAATIGKLLGMIALGVLGLALGGDQIVRSALKIARTLGVSESLVGLSLVAVGTSLPELATTVIAAARRESDIALGNVIGSNLFNTLGVAGPAALIQAAPAPDGLWSAQLAPMLVLTALLPWLSLRPRVGRGWGVLLLACYLVVLGIWFG